MFVSTLAAVCLVGASLAAVPSADASFDSAIEVHRYSFEADEDLDYDRQPDGWSRRRGTGFPQFVRASIDRQTAAHGNQSLMVELNGARFAYYSPMQNIDDQHAYVLRARVRTTGLVHDAALVSVSLLDATRKRVRRILSPPVAGQHDDWVTVDVGPFRPGPDVRFLVVGCHIAQGDSTDVRGKVWFDDLWLGSMPLLELSQAAGLHFLQPGEEIHIAARALGLAGGRPHQLRLKLEDDAGAMLDQTKFDLSPDDVGTKGGPRAPLAWVLPARPNGFYRVRAARSTGMVCPC